MFNISDTYEVSGKTLFTARVIVGSKDIRIEDVNPSYLEELLCVALLQTYDMTHPVQLHWYNDDNSLMHEWRFGYQDNYEATNNDPILITLSVEDGDHMRQLFQEAVDLKTLVRSLAIAGKELASRDALTEGPRNRLLLLSKALRSTLADND